MVAVAEQLERIFSIIPYEEFSKFAKSRVPYGRWFDDDDIRHDAFLRMAKTEDLPETEDGMRRVYRRAFSQSLTDYTRKMGTRQEPNDNIDLVSAPEALERGVPDQVALDELVELLPGMVAQLPPKQREVVEQVALNGETNRSYSDNNGIPLSTVYYRSEKALENLRRLVA